MTFFYEKGFYEKSRNELAKINEKKMKYPYAMYQAYLSIGEKNYPQARGYLNKAMTFSSGNDFLFDLELHICDLCCQLVDHDLGGMQRSLEKLPSHAYDLPLFRFAQGIFSYENGAYLETVKAWKQLNYFLLQQDLSPWGRIALQHLYPQELFQLNLAKCLIEIENYFAAREILEQLLRENYSFALHQKAELYLGFSYLKEAFALSEAKCALKLAAFYFDKIHFDQLSETAEVLFCLEELTLKTLEEQELSAEKLTYLIFPLERWGINTQKMEETLVNRLERNGEEDLDFFKAFQKIAPAKFFRNLQEQLFVKLQMSLEEGTANFSSLWNMLSCNTELATCTQELLLGQMLSRLDKIIFSDSEDLQLFQLQLKMLEQKQITQEHLHAFSNSLFAIATNLWMMPQEEKKATLAMQLAYQLSTKKLIIKTKIEKFLLALFERAQDANLVERLSKIFDAMTLFHITPKCIDHPTTVANHLEDASYRYQCHHFVQAKTLAAWVLKLEPNNQKALKILGLSCYFLGDFEEAYCFLNQLHTPDEQTEKARVLSEVLGRKNKAELVQIQRFEQEN